MDGYSLPYFKGVPRQRGRGIGALASTIARFSFPILKKFVVPAAKKIGRDLVQTATPEIGEVLAGRSSVKKALKRSTNNTLRKQVGGGESLNRRRRHRHQRKKKSKKRTRTTKQKKKSNTKKKKKKQFIRSKKSKQRSRDDFFEKFKQ